MPAEHHASVADNKCRGERYAVYEGMIHGIHRHIGLGNENNGWFAGWRHSHVVLSNCRDTTWITLSPHISHVWHVDKAGTAIIVESGGHVRFVFADGVMAVLNYDDYLDRIHNWGRTYVYYDSKGFLLHYVYNNPNGRLLVFDINDLHLLAGILAKSYQYDNKPGKKPAKNHRMMTIAQADYKNEPTVACQAVYALTRSE